MIMINPPIALIKKNSLGVLQKFGAVRAFLFGSVARGEAKKNSDIDFLIEFKKTPSLVILSALERELSKKLGCSIDIVTPGQLTDRLRKMITPDLQQIL